MLMFIQCLFVAAVRATFVESIGTRRPNKPLNGGVWAEDMEAKIAPLLFTVLSIENNLSF